MGGGLPETRHAPSPSSPCRRPGGWAGAPPGPAPRHTVHGGRPARSNTPARGATHHPTAGGKDMKRYALAAALGVALCPLPPVAGGLRTSPYGSSPPSSATVGTPAPRGWRVSPAMPPPHRAERRSPRRYPRPPRAAPTRTSPCPLPRRAPERPAHRTGPRAEDGARDEHAMRHEAASLGVRRAGQVQDQGVPRAVRGMPALRRPGDS